MYLVNYCAANTIDVPNNFWENIHDPDGEFIDNAKTIRAARMKERIINEAVQSVNRLPANGQRDEERQLR